jgi:hypothetical protein
MSDSEEEPAARRTRAKPDLTVYVSTGSAARSGMGIPTPSSLIGRLDALTRKMAGSGVSQENVFEEYDGLPTPAETNKDKEAKAANDAAVTDTAGGGEIDGSTPDQSGEGLSFVAEDVDPSFLAELESQPPDELAHAARKIQARYRGNKSRAMLASDAFNRPRNKKSKLRNRKHGRDPPKFTKGSHVRRGHVFENSSRYGNANRHGMRALLGQVASTPERSSRHFHAKHIHTHRPLTDTLPPVKTGQTEANEDQKPARGKLHRGGPTGVSQVFPRVNPDGSVASMRAEKEAVEEDLGSDEEEARRIAGLGAGGLEPAYRFAGSKPSYGQREVECFARSLSEDFTNYCRRGGLRRVHYKPARLNNEWRGCSALFRTQVGPWAGSLNGRDQWPGARKQVWHYTFAAHGLVLG